MKVLTIIITILISSMIYAQPHTEIEINDISRWYTTHIKYPIYNDYEQMCAIETFCLGVNEDGELYISSPLNTIHPAFADAIRRITAESPKVRVSSADSVRFIEVSINFHEILPPYAKRQIRFVGNHSYPIFTYNSTGPLNGRRDFVQWLIRKIKVPEKTNNLRDTLSVSYTINTEGRLITPVVSGSNNRTIENIIIKRLMRSPRWIPAKSYLDNSPIPIRIEESVIIDINNGELCFHIDLPTLVEYEHIDDFDTILKKKGRKNKEMSEYSKVFFQELRDPYKFNHKSDPQGPQKNPQVFQNANAPYWK